MATLNNTRISDTYFGLIKTIDNAVISATLKQLTDGSGNATGLYINNAGDFKVNSVLEFGSLKDTGENITITKFVDSADGIPNNNNDTSIPTSKAVKDFVETHVTAQDLDFRGDDATVDGDVDLDSEAFIILGTANEIETTVTSAGGNTLQIGIPTNPALSGNVGIAGNIDFADNARARFGAGPDLEIYHDGSNSFINDSGTGDLYVQASDNMYFNTYGSGKRWIRLTENAGVDLFFNDSVKFETLTGGAKVTGNLEVTGSITGSGGSFLPLAGGTMTGATTNSDDVQVRFGTGNDLRIFHTGGNSYMENVTGDWYLKSANVLRINSTANESMIIANPNAGVELYYDNVKKLESTTNGITITGRISNLTDPTQAQDAATKAYVDALDAASDLDFSDGSNASSVDLNTQTFSIIGTANEVETSASNQQLQIGLPSSINVNSASATILQTARDISLTGEASATISSFNGSSNVSGAVTLDNNSVTGKVLTGLASPTASNILASDSILEAFGKTQSQLNTLAGGLRFMGTWNANTNTPTLASGGGEADSGTTTGTTANKLIDSSQNFTSSVTNGDKVINQDSGASALVTNVDSNTSLTLDADIMVSGQEYTIDNSPFITQGHYYVVSVGGTSSLNGLSNWAVGDWVIAGAGNVWEKLDHTQVDGTGTAGNIAKFSSTNVIADSIMAESGSTISVAGSVDASGLLKVGVNDSEYANNYIRFKSSGAAFIDHNTTSQSIKFRLSNSSALDHITLELTPSYSVFEGNITANSGNITIGGKTYPKLFLNDNQGVARSFSVGTDNETFTVRNETGSTNPLTILGSNNLATFAGDVTVTGNVILNSRLTFDYGGDHYLEAGTNSLSYKSSGGSSIMSLNASTSAATFAGNITFGDSHFIGDDGDDNLLIQSSASENIVLDSADDIILDADGGDIKLQDNGSGFLQFTNSSGNAVITSNTDDKDLIFKGYDGGNLITALTLDMSNGGSATFSDDIDFGGKITQTGSTTNTFGGDITISKSNARLKTISGSEQLNIGNWDGVNYRFEGDANRPIFITSYEGNINLGVSGNTTMNITSSTVGIGGSSSGSKLEIVGGGYNSIRIGSTQAANTNKQAGISMNNYEGNGTSIFQTFCQNNSNAIYYGSADSGFRGIQGHFFMVNADSDATTGHTTAMYISSNARVAIGGTTTSANSLTLQGTGTELDLTNTSTNGRNFRFASESTGILTIIDKTANVERLKLASDGDFTFSGNNVYITPSSGGNAQMELTRTGGANLFLQSQAAVGVIGTGNAESLHLKTNDTSRFIIHPTLNQIMMGDNSINGSFGASNTILAVIGSTSGGEGILQITGKGNNATDNVGKVDFHSYSEADAMCSIRSIRGNADDVGDLAFYTNSGGGAPSQRMIIEDLGDVGIGTASGPGDVNAKLHVYKQAGDNTVNELLRLDCGENNHNVGKGGAIVFRDINVYTDTAKIIAQRIGNTGGSTLQFALRGTEIMRLKSDGKINIGTSTNFHQFEPEADMDFNFIMNAGQINASPNYTIKSSTSGGAIVSRLQLIGSTGNMTITGSLTQNGSISDISLKENIKPVENALDKIEKLNAVSFDWKKSDSILQLKEDYGFIAQEVEEVIPEIVRTNPDDKKVINYNGITSVLVKAIQELKAEVDSLKKQCNCK